MDTRIPLAAQTRLQFRNKAGGVVLYTIVKEISRGGFCIVYDAFYETNSGDAKPVRLKECYPGKLRINRTETGELEAVEEDRPAFLEARKKFRCDFRLAGGLFCAEGLFDALTYTLDIYDGNGTVYLVSAYSPESTLATFRPGDLSTCITLVKQVAQILKRIHREGYLYLDIKPENVLVANSYTTRVQLFDFDSLIPISMTTGATPEDFGNLRLSYSRGFAAIELQTARLRKLGPHTDVYGVGALLFYLLFGITPSAADCEEAAVFDYSAMVYAKDRQDRLYFALTDFFHNALANFCLDRYQDMQQVIDALSGIELLADSARAYIRSTPVAGPGLCLGREQELAMLERWYEGDSSCLLVTGMGGMGKSTLVRAFLSRKRDTMDALLYLTYQRSIPHTLADDRFAGISTVSWDQSETLTDYYARKLTAFRNIVSGTRTVLVLDDFTGVPDETLTELLTVGWKVILISRQSFPVCSYPRLSLGRIEERSSLEKLFAWELGRDLTPEELPPVRQIIAGVAGHTLVLSMLARQIGESCLTVAEAAELVKTHGFSNIAPEEITLEKDQRVFTDTVRGVLNALFRADGLTEPMQSLLKVVSLLPRGIEIPLLQKLLGLETKDDINRLSAGGWLQARARTVDMHPVIRETVHTWPWSARGLAWAGRLMTGLTGALQERTEPAWDMPVTQPVLPDRARQLPRLRGWLERLAGGAEVRPLSPDAGAPVGGQPEQAETYLQLAQAVAESCRREPIFLQEPAWPDLLYATVLRTPRYQEAFLLEWAESLLDHPGCQNALARMHLTRRVLDVYKEQGAYDLARERLRLAEQTARESGNSFVQAVYYDMLAAFWDQVLGGAYRTRNEEEAQSLDRMLSAMDQTIRYARRGNEPECRQLLAEALLGKATVLIRSDPDKAGTIGRLLGEARQIVLEEAPPYARVRWIYYLVCAWHATLIAPSLEETLRCLEKATAIREKLPATDLDGIDEMTVPCADMLCTWQAYELAARLLNEGIEICGKNPDMIPYMRKKAELYSYLMDVFTVWEKPELCRSLEQTIQDHARRCRELGMDIAPFAPSVPG